MIDRHPKGDLSPQIPRHTLHRLLITDPRAVLQQHHFADSDGGIDGRPIPGE